MVILENVQQILSNEEYQNTYLKYSEMVKSIDIQKFINLDS